MSFEVLFYGLLGLNIFQMVYWSYQTHKLINKIMSTDYFSYRKSEVVEKEKKKLPQVQAPERNVHIDFQPV